MLRVEKILCLNSQHPQLFKKFPTFLSESCVFLTWGHNSKYGVRWLAFCHYILLYYIACLFATFLSFYFLMPDAKRKNIVLCIMLTQNCHIDNYMGFFFRYLYFSMSLILKKQNRFTKIAYLRTENQRISNKPQFLR